MKMQIVIRADKESKTNWLRHGVKEGTDLTWIDEAAGFNNYPHADAWIDLGFDDSQDEFLMGDSFKGTVLINSVLRTLNETDASFIRFNGWPGFLNSTTVEMAAHDDKKVNAERILDCFNRKPRWVPDIAGFISARVVCMIINEAFFALAEEVSTKEEIDTAMKLGTNYPYGPFEWADKIGQKKISRLLTGLSQTNERYIPSPRLKMEAV